MEWQLHVHGTTTGLWVLLETVGRSEWWAGVTAQIGTMSPAVLAAFGVGIGAVAVAAGWTSRSARPAARMPA